MPLSSIEPFTLLWLEWSAGIISVFISGLLVLINPNLLPNFIHRIVKYGKSAETHEKLRFLELPKRCFFHFYSVALIFYIFLTTSAINVYFNINLFGGFTQISLTVLKYLLDIFANHDYIFKHQRVASVPPESVLIGLCLLIIQVTRRLCECKLVSVYSDAQMNFIHYMFGHLFYFGVGLSMLAEAPGFTGSVPSLNLRSSKFEIFTPCHMIGVSMFLLSSYVQFDSHRILANLRKDRSGRVYTTRHSIPRGKWFNLVSSPHYMAEILIYLAITIVLGGRSSTWWMVFVFVVTNQIFVALFNHSWYLQTFKDYPKSRRAIIPYVL